MRAHCLKCPLFRKFVIGANSEANAKIGSLMEHLADLKKEIERRSRERTPAPASEPEPKATPGAGQHPPEGYKPILDLAPEQPPAPEVKKSKAPAGDPAPMYRHKCTDPACGAVRINRIVRINKCIKCGSPMQSAIVNSTGKRYKKKKGAAGKKAALSPDHGTGEQEEPKKRGLEALFDQHPIMAPAPQLYDHAGASG